MERVGQASLEIGYPVFLRGDLTSGKHQYKKTCLVPSPTELRSHIWALIEASAITLDEVPRAFVVRKLLTLEAPFTAFQGLPIASARRYFIRDGHVECHHAYWPEDAIRFWDGQGPQGWRGQLARLNQELPNEITTLTDYAECLGIALPGYWSVDFALDGVGRWWFIDAAKGEDSWHSHPPRLEMFARRRLGWDVWGNEVGGKP